MCKMCALLNSIIFIVQNTAIEIIFNPNEALRSITQTCPLYNNPLKISTPTYTLLKFYIVDLFNLRHVFHLKIGKNIIELLKLMQVV